ncbi:MAG: flagellar basal body rod protein FlgB [Deltaproteobacteria bacterium]|nr:flagellar basal body rod protein FlgB [Deltaproteobacteria bacterium]MBW2015404.1 flagellar basal body rod protein FlgB [Deltaproteobacteria bacterium]
MDRLNGKGITGKTVSLLARALDFRSANHNVISSNLANIDTPGFRPKEISFSEALKREVEKTGLPLRKTDPNHFSHFTGSLDPGERVYTVRTSKKPVTGTSQINIDREMAKMVENNLLFEASARLLAKKFEALKLAIESGRR